MGAGVTLHPRTHRPPLTHAPHPSRPHRSRSKATLEQQTWDCVCRQQGGLGQQGLPLTFSLHGHKGKGPV